MIIWIKICHLVVVAITFQVSNVTERGISARLAPSYLNEIWNTKAVEAEILEDSYFSLQLLIERECDLALQFGT